MGRLFPRSPRRAAVGWRCGALGAALLLLAGGAAARLHAQRADTVVFVNVNVVLTDRYEILPDQMVVVQAGRIAEIKPAGAGAAPAGARLVEAQGRYLVPGLIELNGRIPHPKDVYGREDALLAYLARGVTGVRGHRTHSSQAELQRRIEEGKLLGPRLS
jgi:imidazolonepropionase-like amidohydrolase